ncbi:MAG: hypothetical protein HPY75_05850 [Actinobacteria bacterium]|nr:hypothetical protein [Actinomycetota bacterium]
MSLLPEEGVDWSMARPPRRVWLDDVRGDHGARLEFLAAQGLRLIMFSPGPAEGGTLHFHNPRDGETLHLRAEGGRCLLPEAVASFPAASRWMTALRGAEEGMPRDLDAPVLLAWEGCLVAVEAGRVTGLAEAWVECPGVVLRGSKAAQACEALEKAGGYEGVARALSFAQACEEARGMKVPPAAMALRALLLESARAQSHLSWMGEAVALLGKRRLGAACRELCHVLEEAVSSWLGDPLGRGWVVPGGVRESFPIEVAEEILASLNETSRRWEELSGRIAGMRAPRWMEKRLAGLRELAGEATFTGPLARSLGMEVDVRAEEPGAYALLGWEIAVRGEGSLFADLLSVKAREVTESLRVIRQVLECPPGRPLEARRGRGGRNEGFGRCEGPEGEVCCHLALEKGVITYLAFSHPAELNRAGASVLRGCRLDEAEPLFLPWKTMAPPAASISGG